jgi:hypothetical protein
MSNLKLSPIQKEVIEKMRDGIKLEMTIGGFNKLFTEDGPWKTIGQPTINYLLGTGVIKRNVDYMYPAYLLTELGESISI